MEEYVILMLNDSAPVKVMGVNLKMLETLINKPESIAVRIGKKSMVKNLIAAVVKMDSIAETVDRNFKIVVRDTPFYTSAQSDTILDTLTNDINKKAFALVNDEILINRGCYQYAEYDDKTVEESEVVQGETIIDNKEETQADA
ncbi:hypothetical protein [Lysinibacillus sp. BNK-21]|uniref:hypothetical protein n=1 Tax=Lysinibacillus sp. BNK-21 TaxID=3376156 RepID=UPI003B438FBE